jgi:hypothetical protein
VGKNGQLRIVRGLVEFDVAGSIPAGASINAVSLTLYMSRTSNPTVETIGLHRALAEWGEGGSLAPNGEGIGTSAQLGDATWIYTFFASDSWTAAGGDFSPVASASTGVGVVGSYVWSSAQLAADVEDFLADPAGNHGWVVVGNESSLAKRFDSRAGPVVAQRPQLLIDYSPPSGVPALGTAGIALLGVLLTSIAFWRRAAMAWR